MIISVIAFLLTDYEHKTSYNELKLWNHGVLRHLQETFPLIKKNHYFDLKVPLFVENRKNKFAYEIKKNKFVSY